MTITDFLLRSRYRGILPLLLLAGGLFFSRALLSWMMAAGILLLLLPDVRRDFIAVFKRPVSWLIGLLVLFYGYLFVLDPGFYTIERLGFHLSLIGLLCLLQFMAVSGRLLLWALLAIGFLTTIPTLVDLVFNTGLSALYGKGQVAFSLLKNDHQRFAIWASGCLGLSWYLWLRKGRPWMMLGIAWFSVFILLFAVRTGWLFLVLVNITGGLMYIRKLKVKQQWILSITLLSLLAAAILTVPVIREKIRYVRWEWTYQAAAEKMGASDAMRRMVNHSTIELIEKSPVGYGTANARKVLHLEVEKQHPQVQSEYEWPFCQYLQWWYSAGWFAGSLPLLLILFLLYRLYHTGNRLTFTWALFIALTGVYESTLELQYGFFLSVFFGALLYLYESGLAKRAALSLVGESRSS